MTDPFRILVVCTGNICRSPAGELLLQHLLGDSVTVSSAGTHALVDHPIEPQMAALLPERLAADRFRSRQLTPAMLRDADLVLTMSREHRSDTVQLVPAAVRRTFTFTEFARILGMPGQFSLAATPGDFLRESLELAGKLRHRSKVTAGATRADDIVDPYQRDDAVFAQSYADIEAAARAIAAATHQH